MELQLSAERQTQLAAYAERHGQEPSVALDEVLGDALALDLHDYEEAVAGITRGYEAVKAGRTRLASEFMQDLREKHGF